MAWVCNARFVGNLNNTYSVATGSSYAICRANMAAWIRHRVQNPESNYRYDARMKSDYEFMLLKTRTNTQYAKSGLYCMLTISEVKSEIVHRSALEILLQIQLDLKSSGKLSVDTLREIQEFEP